MICRIFWVVWLVIKIVMLLLFNLWMIFWMFCMVIGLILVKGLLSIIIFGLEIRYFVIFKWCFFFFDSLFDLVFWICLILNFLNNLLYCWCWLCCFILRSFIMVRRFCFVLSFVKMFDCCGRYFILLFWVCWYMG